MHSALFKNLCYDQVAYQQEMFEGIIKTYVSEITVWTTFVAGPGQWSP